MMMKVMMINQDVDNDSDDDNGDGGGGGPKGRSREGVRRSGTPLFIPFLL
jgi:hypothetical protein